MAAQRAERGRLRTATRSEQCAAVALAGSAEGVDAARVPPGARGPRCAPARAGAAATAGTRAVRRAPDPGARGLRSRTARGAGAHDRGLGVLTLGARARIYVAAEAVDLRKGFDTLAAATRSIIREDPLSGHWFVFVNRRRNRLKVLVWEPSGYLMLYKRLERGRFQLPTTPRLGARHVE